jgi:sigma-54 dependent transcriptional regulator, acetoin dehydrogenase operon transcriptional activator AcoR
MLIEKSNHAAFVKLTVSSVLGQTLSDPISRSWRRCIEVYELDPASAPEVMVVEGPDLRERQERLADLLVISKSELMNLYEQIAGSGFAMSIACSEGVIVDYVADSEITNSFAKLGLCVGGSWSEPLQGTNVIGTCLIEKQPLVVHKTDHFLPRNILLTSSGAPIFNHQGEPLAVLSASGNYEVAQRHTLALVNTGARTIENRLFLHYFREAAIVRFDIRPEFVGTVREGEMAISQSGAILGANRNALSQLGYSCHRDVVGKSIADIFNTSHGELIQRNAKGMGALISVFAKDRNKRYFATIKVPEGVTASNVSTTTGRKKRRESSSRQDSVTREILLDELALGDPRMAMNVRYVKNMRDRDIPILVCGETGTGKEVMARAIHSSHDGDSRPFVAVNCAAIPEPLIESELFGYAPGAFTGANREGQDGKIVQANNGTLFLDEIGDMPLPLQARLLRVLEQREIQRLGGVATTKVDILLISATNRNLTELVAAGRFRSDLYYRLQGLMLSLPPLRERRDKLSLIKHMVELESQRHLKLGDWRQGPIEIDDQALHLLNAYDWPGNIRQLRTVIRVSLAVCSGPSIGVDDLPEEITKGREAPRADAVNTADSDLFDKASATEMNSTGTLDFMNPVDAAERIALVQALERQRWNIAKVARHLHVSRLTVYRKMRRLGISKQGDN